MRMTTAIAMVRKRRVRVGVRRIDERLARIARSLRPLWNSHTRVMCWSSPG